MAVKIRLQRLGKKNKAFYRIVAMDESFKRNGKILALLGHFDPTTNPPTISFNKKEIDKWLGYGAQMTDSIRNILLKQNRPNS